MRKAMTPPRKAKSPKIESIAEETSKVVTSGATRVETAQYIADFTAELSYLARETRLDLLAYLLEMARLEAIRAVQASNKNP